MSREEVLVLFVLLVLGALFSVGVWKGFQKAQIHLHSRMRKFLFGLGTAWLLVGSCMGLFLFSERVGAPHLLSISLITVAYCLGIYLPFLTVLLLVWGMIRAVWKGKSKEGERNKDVFYKK